MDHVESEDRKIFIKFPGNLILIFFKLFKTAQRGYYMLAAGMGLKIVWYLETKRSVSDIYNSVYNSLLNICIYTYEWTFGLLRARLA